MHCTSDALPDEWSDTADAETVDKLQQLRERLAAHRITEAELLRFGLLLGNALVPATVQRPLVQHLAHASRRVRLRIVTHDPELAALPWEYLRLPSQFDDLGGSPLALDDRVSLVRSPAQGPAPVADPLLRTDGELRVLHASATEVDGFEPLRGDDHAVDQALWGESARRTRRVVVDRLSDPATRASLEEALRASPDLMVFTGHATLDHSGRSSLVLAGPDGSSDLVAGGELAAMLLRAGTRLVVLNGCDTATSGEVSISLTEMLVRSGVETVVGMQMPISDSNAGHFAVGMIGALSEGHSVDASVAQGRKRIADRAGYAEWGIPTLMTSARQAEPALPEEDLRRRPAEPLRPVVSRGGTMTAPRPTLPPVEPTTPAPVTRNRRNVTLAVALTVLASAFAFWWIQSGDDDLSAAGEPTPDPAPASTAIPATTARPWSEGVFSGGSLNDPNLVNTSEQLRARIDAFQAASDFPAVQGPPFAEAGPERLSWPVPPARLSSGTTNDATNEDCARVRIEDMTALGAAISVWQEQQTGLIITASQFGDEHTARQNFWATSLYSGLRPGECSGWPEGGVAVNPTDLEVTRRDFPVQASPDDWITAITEDAEIGLTVVRKAYTSVFRVGDIVVVTGVGSLDGSLPEQDAIGVITEVMQAFDAE